MFNLNATALICPEEKMRKITPLLMCVVISLFATSTAWSQTSSPTTESEITKHLAQVATDLYLTEPQQLGLSDQEEKNINCMIENVFMEARGEDNRGKLLVANVVMNRVKHDNWPSTICGVVHQPSQFSWTAHKSGRQTFKRAKRNITPEYRNAVSTALYATLFQEKPVTDATYFYAPAVVKNPPSWSRSKKFKLVEKHQNHYFFKQVS